MTTPIKVAKTVLWIYPAYLLTLFEAANAKSMNMRSNSNTRESFILKADSLPVNIKYKTHTYF